MNYREKVKLDIELMSRWYSLENSDVKILIYGLSGSGISSFFQSIMADKESNIPHVKDYSRIGSFTFDFPLSKNALLIDGNTVPPYWMPEASYSQNKCLFVVDNSLDFFKGEKSILYDEFHRVLGYCNQSSVVVAVAVNFSKTEFPPNPKRLEEIATHLRLKALTACAWYRDCSAAIFSICVETGKDIFNPLYWLIRRST